MAHQSKTAIRRSRTEYETYLSCAAYPYASACSLAAEQAKYEQADTTQTTVPPRLRRSRALTLCHCRRSSERIMPSRLPTVLFARAPRVAMVCQWCFLIRSTQAHAGRGFQDHQRDGSTGSLVRGDAYARSRCWRVAHDIAHWRIRVSRESCTPVNVDIVGNRYPLTASINFRDSSATVIPIEDGPTLIYAEIVPGSQWECAGDQSTGRRFGAR